MFFLTFSLFNFPLSILRSQFAAEFMSFTSYSKILMVYFFNGPFPLANHINGESINMLETPALEIAPSSVTFGTECALRRERCRKTRRPIWWWNDLKAQLPVLSILSETWRLYCSESIMSRRIKIQGKTEKNNLEWLITKTLVQRYSTPIMHGRHMIKKENFN